MGDVDECDGISELGGGYFGHVRHTLEALDVLVGNIVHHRSPSKHKNMLVKRKVSFNLYNYQPASCEATFMKFGYVAVTCSVKSKLHVRQIRSDLCTPRNETARPCSQ